MRNEQDTVNHHGTGELAVTLLGTRHTRLYFQRHLRQVFVQSVSTAGELEVFSQQQVVDNVGSGSDRRLERLCSGDSLTVVEVERAAKLRRQALGQCWRGHQGC